MSRNKLYVGNLDYALTEDNLRSVFEKFGTVEEVKLIVDRDNNSRSKGFAFVTMGSDDEASQAVDGLRDTEIEGRPVKVSYAREKRPPQRRNFNNSRY